VVEIIDRRKPKYLEKKLFQCHFVQHESHVTGMGSKPGLRSDRLATNHLIHGTGVMLTT
jgi:hypothetical protein